MTGAQAGLDEGSILVVDDNEMNRDMLSRRLARAGYAVTVAEDGTKALGLIGEGGFDLILLDVMMPGLSGLEVLKTVREKHPMAELPVIMVTAKGESDDMVQAFRLGANDYVGKPVDFPVALSRVRTQLQLKRSQEQLAAARAEALAASRAKSDFLASMSHEIRTPLNSIVGYSDLISETSLDDEQRHCVRVIRAASDALLSLVNDVLDLSKIEAGRLELESIPFDLRELVRATADIMSVRTSDKGLGLECSVSDGVPALLAGDPTRLRQIFINLIGNSVKFTSKGGITLRAELDPDGGAPEAIRVSVTDTGIGIAPDKLESVFDRFSQAEASTTRKYGGTGLGLSICRRLAELMGGRMWVESELGKGSTFRFTARLRPASGRPAAKTAAPAAPAGGPRRPLRILLAEDNPQNRNLILAYLKGAPHQVDVVENGEEAFAKFAAGTYDVVLMDMEMPVLDGYGATARIRAWEKERGAAATPVVALTAHSGDEHAGKGAAAGCTSHLEKPIRKDKLLEALVAFTQASGTPPETAGKILVEVPGELREIIPEFLEMTRKDAAAMLEACGKGDAELVRRLGHSLKGAGGGYGFPRLTELGAALEQAAKAGDAEGMAGRARELADYMDRIEVSFE